MVFSQKVSSRRIGMACCICVNIVLCVEMPSEWEEGERFLLNSLLCVHHFYELRSTPLFDLILPSGVFLCCNAVIQFHVNADHSLKGPAVWTSIFLPLYHLGRRTSSRPSFTSHQPQVFSSLVEHSNSTALYLRTFCIYFQNTVYHLYNLFVCLFRNLFLLLSLLVFLSVKTVAIGSGWTTSWLFPIKINGNGFH